LPSSVTVSDCTGVEPYRARPVHRIRGWNP
jgi:hypothetical protein